MYKSTVLLFCIISLLYQVYAADSSSEELENRNLVTDNTVAKLALQKMMDAIDKALKLAQVSLDKVYNDVKVVADAVKNKLKEKIDANIRSPIRKRFNELRQKVKNLGLDMKTKCQKHVDEFEALPNKTLDAVFACVTIQLDAAKSYCDDALANVQKIRGNVASFPQDIEKCGIVDVDCSAELLKKIHESTIGVPARITVNVMETATLMASLRPAIEQCLIVELGSVPVAALKISANYASCAGLLIV